MSIFGDRLYLELQDNGMAEQRKVNEGLLRLADHYNLPLVATNDCHYLRKQEAQGARAPPVHPDGQEDHRYGPAEALDRGVLLQVARRDGDGPSPTIPRPSQIP